MKNFVIACVMFLLCIIFASDLCADEVTYYAPDGTEISKKLYEILKKEHGKKLNEKKKDRQVKVGELQNTNVKNEIPYDMLGRPLKTPGGLWITYPDDPNYYSSNNSSPSSSSYGSCRTNMSSASMADKYKEKYLKDGKTTDLVVYKKAVGRALGMSPSADRSSISHARKADRYRESYLKDGKITDLVEYKKALGRALGN